jgi:hypothetical protein
MLKQVITVEVIEFDIIYFIYETSKTLKFGEALF